MPDATNTIIWDGNTAGEAIKTRCPPLVKINELTDWENFRTPIETAIRKDMSKGGRPPYDAILMYKITMLQQWYGLLNDAAEYHINDSLTFMRFLGLGVGDKVPDGNTIWDFKEAFKAKAKEIDRKLFDLFNKQLEEQGIITHTGSIVDATFVLLSVTGLSEGLIFKLRLSVVKHLCFNPPTLVGGSLVKAIKSA